MESPYKFAGFQLKSNENKKILKHKLTMRNAYPPLIYETKGYFTSGKKRRKLNVRQKGKPVFFLLFRIQKIIIIYCSRKTAKTKKTSMEHMVYLV